MKETHWDLSITQDGAGTITRCGCGWYAVVPARWHDEPDLGLRLRMQSNDINACRTAWSDHKCVGRPLESLGGDR